MATIPSPVTWNPGDTPADSYFNSNIRDALNLFLSPPRCVVRDNTVPTISALTWTLLSWAIEDVKSEAGMHSTSSNSSRIIAVTAGRYLVNASVRWQDHSIAGNDGGVQIQVRKNAAGSATGGTMVAEESHHGTDHIHLYPYSNVEGHVTLAAGDYLEAFVRHSYSGSGSTSTILNTDDQSSQFAALWISSQ